MLSVARAKAWKEQADQCDSKGSSANEGTERKGRE